MNQAQMLLTQQFENLVRLKSFSDAFLKMAFQKKGGNNVVLSATDAMNLHTIMVDLAYGNDDILNHFVIPPKAKEHH